MARAKVKEKRGSPNEDKQPTKDAADEFYDFDHDSDVESMPRKDETEERLEKLIFGDEAGFLEGLKHPTRKRDGALVRTGDDKEAEPTDEADSGLDDVPDADLFFLDSGTGNAPTSHAIATQQPQAEKEDRTPVWMDSDDDRFTVSLATNTRLRKLRDAEGEDIITGREYIRRLRRQYERLHPTPEWAKRARDNLHHPQIQGNHPVDADADSDSDISMDDESSIPSTQPLAELLRSASALTRVDDTDNRPSKRRKLRPAVVDIQRTKDVTSHGPSSVDTLQFHPYYPLLLSAGPSSTISLHHISPHPPHPNPLLTSLHLKGTPLHTAEFCTFANDPDQANSSSADPTRIFLSSRRRYFHTWSLATGAISKISRPVYGDARADQRTMESFRLSPCGRLVGLVGSARKGGGNINVISTDTMQWICSCRIDSRGGIADFAWWRDGEGFSVVGKNGEVSEYDIEQRRVVMRWLDDGAVGTTVIAQGGNSGHTQLGGSRYVAIGSSSGIVNVYDRQTWKDNPDEAMVNKPTPLRTLDHLTTPTSHLHFSTDGQMLVMASRWKKDALRLVHLPSCTVYRNWPTDQTPLGRIASVALSPDGRYLAVGNEQGRIRLWEIRE